MTSSVAAALNCERLGATAQILAPSEVLPLAGENPEAERFTAIDLHLAHAFAFEEASSPIGRLIAGIPAAIEHTLGRNDVNALIADFERTHALAAVGSGSSYTAALAAEVLARRLLPAPYAVRAFQPGGFLALGRPGETVLCISQSGNPDIDAAIAHARRLGAEPFVLTARQGGFVEELPPERIFRHHGDGVKTFVNARGPCAAAAFVAEWLAQQAGRGCRGIEQYIDIFDRAREQVGALELPSPSFETYFVALASGLMLAPLHELDLKFAECGLDIESSEIKGWTHGRFQRAWRHFGTRPLVVITIETPRDVEVIDGIE